MALFYHAYCLIQKGIEVLACCISTVKRTRDLEFRLTIDRCLLLEGRIKMLL